MQFTNEEYLELKKENDALEQLCEERRYRAKEAEYERDCWKRRCRELEKQLEEKIALIAKLEEQPKQK